MFAPLVPFGGSATLAVPSTAQPVDVARQVFARTKHAVNYPPGYQRAEAGRKEAKVNGDRSGVAVGWKPAVRGEQDASLLSFSQARLARPTLALRHDQRDRPCGRENR